MKLSDKIKMEFTGEIAPEYRSIISSEVLEGDTGIPQGISALRQYDVKVCFGVRTRCMETQKKDMLENVSHQVVEEIFGELRRKIYQVQQHIFERNEAKAIKVIGEILEEMK